MKLWDRLKLIWYGGFAVTGAVLGIAYGLAGYGVLGAFGWAVLGVAAAVALASSLDLLLKLLSHLS